MARRISIACSGFVFCGWHDANLSFRLSGLFAFCEVNRFEWVAWQRGRARIPVVPVRRLGGRGPGNLPVSPICSTVIPGWENPNFFKLID